MGVLFVAAVMAIVLWAFFPGAKLAVKLGLDKAGITVMRNMRALVFTKPRPDAPASVFTFNGVDIKGRFFGTVVAQHAMAAAPAEQPAKPLIVLPD